jgi:NADPH:quinone reductase
MRAWILHGYGDPGDVLTCGELPEPSPGRDQVLVEVEAVGVAFPDLLRVRGEYQIPQPLETAPCSEFVGRVRASGTDVRIPPGTRVMGIADIGDGALADLVVARQASICPVPEDMPASTAATLSTNYATSYLALHTRARVQAGEIVLVNGGAGGIGSAAIQLACAAGGRVIANDIGPDRAALCRQVGAEEAFDASADDLVTAVNQFSAGHGADVVIDPVGGDVFDACRRCIASEGRIVIVGFTSGRIPELRLNHLVLRNFTVMGVNAFFYPDEITEVMPRIVDLCVSGQVTPPVEGEYRFEDAVDVFNRLAAGQIRGRAVVKVQ